MEINLKISETIKYLREFNKLNQSDFGKLIDKGASLVSAYEKGTAVPPIQVLMLISNKFKISIDDIVKGNIKNYNINGVKDEKYTATISSERNSAGNYEIIEKDTKSKSYRLKYADLGMILSDNMKMLYFLVTVLRSKKYEFSEKEKHDLKFYGSLEELLMTIITGKESITDDEYEHLNRIIKSSLFSFINGLLYETEKVLNIETEYSFDEII